MLNVNNIENVDYIWVFDQLGDYLDDEQNFTSQEDYNWWEKLADSLAYLEEEEGINTRNLEINELEDYITIAEEHGFKENKMREKLSADLLNATYTNEDGTMDLEFRVDEQMVYVKNVEIEYPADEFYWDDDERVERAIAEAEDEDIVVE